MKNKWMNYWIDAGMAAAGTACLATGIVKWPGLIAALGLKYSSLPITAITGIHDWSGLAVGLLATAHVLMHARWIEAMTQKALALRGGTKDE